MLTKPPLEKTLLRNIHKAKSFLWRQNNRLRAFENWVLRRVFGPKNDEVTGEWRKLHNEELRGGKIEKKEVGGACGAHWGGERCAQGSSG